MDESVSFHLKYGNFFVVFKNLNKYNAVSVLLGIDTFKATTVFC